MSINSCSINEYTINTLCGSRRRAIIDSLLPQVNSTDRGHQQHVGNLNRINQQIFKRDNREEQEEQINLELSHINVTVEILGAQYSQTMERPQGIIPLVTISNIDVSTDTDYQINISNIQIRTL